MKKLKRNINSSIFLNDVGTTVPAMGELIIDPSQYILFSESSDVVTALANGNLTYNDGTKDLSLSEAIDHLKGYWNKEVTISAQTPFARPDYRYKINSNANIETVNPGQAKDIDHLLLDERYIQGGQVVYSNPEFGDYITAEIYDVNAIIPEPYRAAMCEAWPSVAKYIIKQWINPFTNTLKIDSYPLIAKITAGLSLRVTYHAINSGADRKVCVTYFKTKKLI